MTPADETLYGMGQLLLTRVLGCFTQQGITPPDKQLVYLSPIPADCDQVAVLFSGTTPMPPLFGLVMCAPFRWAGQFSIIIVRKSCAVPNKRGEPPTAELMSQAARVASDDAEVLLALAGTFTEAGGLDLLVHPVTGGYQAVVLDVTLPMAGWLS